MRNVFLFLPVLALAALPAWADGGGVVSFSGAIREPTCAVTANALACGSAQVSAAQPAAGHPLARVPLFAYALARDPAIRWRVIEVVYR
jgi:hypothetical protein